MWSVAEIMNATHGRATGRMDWTARNIAIDSRKVTDGDLFIALKGDHYDGHDYIDAAFKGGAVAALSQHPVPEKHNAIIVNNTMDGLCDLAVAARERTHDHRIAITGSVGKTGTKNLVADVLTSYGKTHSSHGNYNNHIGVPLSMARMPADTMFSVFEVGMNHSGEISPLSRMIAPDIAIITRIADSHSGHFSSLDAIAEAKAEIFEGLKANSIAIINSDDAYRGMLEKHALMHGAGKVITFGHSDLARNQIIQVRRTENGLDVLADFGGIETAFTLQMMAPHWAYAAMIALTVAEHLGLPLGPAIRTLATIKDMPGRGCRSLRHLECDGKVISFTLIDDSYNASPASMTASILTLRDDPLPGKKIAVLGDMLELGEDAPQKHIALAAQVIDSQLDVLITVGDLMRHLNDALPDDKIALYHASDAREAIQTLNSVVKSGDVVLVKGSRGLRLDAIIAAFQAEEGGGDAR